VVDFLADDPILLAFLVVGIGAAIGSIRIRGISIGPAAALFVGLAVGAVDESLSGAGGLTILRELGLVLFTYTIGLAAGPTFFAGLRRGGIGTVAVTFALVGVLAGIVSAVAGGFGFTPAERAGLFAGSATNTPSLQAAVEAVKEGDPVVAYSLAYPAAVVSMLLVLTLLIGRRLPLPTSLEPPPPPPKAADLVNWTITVSAAGLPALGELRHRYEIGFSRIGHDGVVSVAVDDHLPEPGDSLVVVGPPDEVERFCNDVGQRSDLHLPLDRTALDFRRILVSNRRLAGKRLVDLDLVGRYGVSVTRVRRGDEDLVADDNMVLALGDRVRVVGPTEAIGHVALVLGDSERGLSEVDAVGLALGIAAGLALGAVKVPLPGGGELSLGAGGGPLIIGLLLGFRSRIGPITFQLPHGANLVLRQIGVLVFLAAAGLASGSTFADALGTGTGLKLMAAGAVCSLAFALFVPLVIEVVLHKDHVATSGIFAGVETQPAALAYAVERTGGDERVNMAYALAFPAAMIAKIIVVQFLV
jgi:putative transport protein